MNMNFIQIQAFAGFWTAAILMICFHNMIISIALYKIRKNRIYDSIPNSSKINFCRQFGLSSKFTQSDHKLSNLSSNDQTYSQIIDDDRIVVVSMKRLSFLEWASTTIVDEDDENYKNDEKNDNDENDENAKDKNNDRKINDTSTETSNMEIIIH
ncbi:unnamed protein product [Rhizophagus irregularis]|nr:unnamed protein product [Rhizophagus irregularis]